MGIDRLGQANRRIIGERHLGARDECATSVFHPQHVFAPA